MRLALGTTVLGLAVALGGMTATGSAGAAVATCDGRPATITGTAGRTVRGTTGDDVIVTNGAVEVYADAGDDTVCVTGRATRVDADLGPGDDLYVGGPGDDYVVAAAPWTRPRAQGADRISTGTGADLVVTGGAPSHPDTDAIDLGPGADVVRLEGVISAAHPVVGGSGWDEIEFSRDSMRSALQLDNSQGRATDPTGRVVMAWSGLERFALHPFFTWAAPSFVGGDGPESVTTRVPLTQVALGGGDDRLDLRLDVPDRRMIERAAYDGGAGADTFKLMADAGTEARRVDLDIARHRLRFVRGREPVHARVRGFETHLVSADRVHVRGTAGGDRIVLFGCHGRVNGGGGDDVLGILHLDDVSCGYLDRNADLVLQGGAGDDRLRGGWGPDVLLGGPGHDVADGRGSAEDRCVAEVTTHCEA